MLQETRTEFSNTCVLAGANYSRRLCAAREIKRTCGDGREDILGVVGEKSDTVILILDQVYLCWLLAFCLRSCGDKLTAARSWGQMGSGSGSKRERDAFELGTQNRNWKVWKTSKLIHLVQQREKQEKEELANFRQEMERPSAPLETGLNRRT